jgi:hypothetical protein
MDGPARDRRLARLERSYAPTRLSEEMLRGAYDCVLDRRDQPAGSSRRCEHRGRPGGGGGDGTLRGNGGNAANG